MDDSTSERSHDAVAQSLESNLGLKLCRMLGFMCMTWKRQLAVEMESPLLEHNPKRSPLPSVMAETQIWGRMGWDIGHHDIPFFGMSASAVFWHPWRGICKLPSSLRAAVLGIHEGGPSFTAVCPGSIILNPIIQLALHSVDVMRYITESRLEELARI